MTDKGGVKMTDIGCWEYRGEGNASLVIANKKDHRILKLSKCSAESASSKDVNDSNHKDDVKQQAQYVQTIMKPLLGSFVCVPEVVSISQEFLQSIHNMLNKLRPEGRLHKIIDIQRQFALSLPDLSFLHPVYEQSDNPVFCVEIKPKTGFIPSSPWISSEREVKKTVCRYCMQQHYKVKQGSWNDVSRYCPIDLFSGDPGRMKYALHQLLENSQNNLRIFKNGYLLYAAPDKQQPTANDKQNLYQNLKDFFGDSALPEEMNGNVLERSVLQNFLNVVIKILLDTRGDIPLLHHDRQKLSSQACQASCYDATKISNKRDSQVIELPQGSVLEAIKQAQMLDDMDIEAIFPLYQKVTSAIEKGDISREKYQLDWPFDDKGFTTGKLDNGSQISTTLAPSAINTVTMETAVHKIRKFLVAGTAKDCSILLAIQPTGNKGRSWNYPHICHHGNKSYLYSCHIIDLDPKPASRIPKYNKLDQEIVDNYNSI